jgi:hypothetical protein
VKVIGRETVLDDAVGKPSEDIEGGEASCCFACSVLVGATDCFWHAASRKRANKQSRETGCEWVELAHEYIRILLLSIEPI